MKSQDESPDILTKAETARLLRVSPRKVDYMVAARELPHIQVGKRSIRFQRSSLLKWLQKREQGNDE